MVPGVRPVIELPKLPEPVPSVVLLFAVVGFAVIPQQTPRTVMADPPSLMILPPLVAVVEARSVIELVVNEAKTADALAVT